jgi:hypothetical protein
MRVFVALIVTILVHSGLTGCSSAPPPRIAAYLGQEAETVSTAEKLAPSGRFEAGLLVINDTFGVRSAPALSDQSMAFLTDSLTQQLQRELPVTITQIIPSEGFIPPTDLQAIVHAVKQHGVQYCVVAIVSSQESEVPDYLPLDGTAEQGGTKPQVPGYYAQNYALVELALVQVENGKVVANSDGRAWASLNRLNVPVNSTGYPVVHRSLQIAPIFPTEANAKDVLRSIAALDASEQAVMHLSSPWRKRMSATCRDSSVCSSSSRLLS